MASEDELDLLRDAFERAAAYLSMAENRRVYPSAEDIARLSQFDEKLPDKGNSAQATLALMDRIGSPATVASNGPNYFGFVVGASLPVAAAAEHLALAWDQCAASDKGGPAAAKLEEVAARWVLEILDLPRESGVGFGTSAAACGLVCLTAARSHLLSQAGWDFENDGLAGAPAIRVIASEMAHITIKKALRVMGFGLKNVCLVPTDADGRVDPKQLPEMDDRTLLVPAGRRGEHRKL